MTRLDSTKGTEVQEGVPLHDPGNALRAILPAQLVAGIEQHNPGGERLVLTIRTVNGTTTVYLTRDEAREWYGVIRAGMQSMSGLIVPNGVVVKPPPN